MDEMRVMRKIHTLSTNRVVSVQHITDRVAPGRLVQLRVVMNVLETKQETEDMNLIVDRITKMAIEQRILYNKLQHLGLQVNIIHISTSP